MKKSTKRQEMNPPQLRTIERLLTFVEGGADIGLDAGSTSFHPEINPLGQAVRAGGNSSAPLRHNHLIDPFG